MAILQDPAFLRDNGFLTRGRMRGWAFLLLAGYAAAILYLALTAQGLNDYQGRPLGTDFSDIYASGAQALRGDTSAPFDIQRQYAEEQALFGAATPVYGWHYPPFFLLVAAPLAELPYLPALIVWQLGTLLLYLAALGLLLRRTAPKLAADRLWVLVALAFPAVFVNLIQGHNGFLTAALFAGALALLDARPLSAGVLFGLLCYKPQFAIVLPLVLAATGRWRTFLSAAVTVAALVVAVTIIFGGAIWPAFLAGTHFTRTVVLEQGSTGFFKIQSIFAWVRMTGGSVPLAYFLQTAADAALMVALVRIWRSDVGAAIKGAALCLGTLLVTPYSLDYDLMLLAPAIALLAADAAMTGLRPWRGLLIAALWFMPFVARVFAEWVGQPIAVPLMLLAMAVLYCQAMTGRRRPSLRLLNPDHVHG